MIQTTCAVWSAGKEPRAGERFQLTFPLRTNYMYAKARRSLPEMVAFTAGLWLKSNASPGVGTPFSYAVPGQANELVLIEWGNHPMEILINDKVRGGRGAGRGRGRGAGRSPQPLSPPQVAKLPFLINDGKWHHLCITWTTRDGVWEAFQDGAMLGSGENLAPYHPIKPEGVLVLGQEQVSAPPPQPASFSRDPFPRPHARGSSRLRRTRWAEASTPRRPTWASWPL